MKKLYLMTDLEGVAGVVDAENWIYTHSRYYDLAKDLLTAEVNAAIEGFLEAGVEEILVADGHGQGALFSHKLDPRILYQRGWIGWPLSLDRTFDAIAWVGQHAKAGTPEAHLAHTQSFEFIDFTINGVSVGEPGQFGYCASELGVRAIFGAGDLAFTRELTALYPGIETVSVKHGVNPGSGDDMSLQDYQKSQLCAVHVSPQVARERIRAGAERAVRRAKDENFGLLPLKAPFECVMTLRPSEKFPQKRVSRWSHPSSVIAALNMNWMANLQPVTDAKHA
jgi:D-amino peptidase